MKETKNPKKPLIYYYLAALLVLLLINAFLTPLVRNSQTVNVTYDKFLTMVKAGQVQQVEVDSDQIAFTLKDTSDKRVYITGVWDDPTLTQTLNDAGVSYGKVIPE